ncbi:MAG TPA: molecular chaperone DnaJ [Ruminococcaceae bacterium]|mgnify:CR=1 FL=1|nr:molecular chaperone DnaJ [Oscillospiraceae bacterium]
MTDPYQVLGISSNASDEEVKAAYRKLVKKYHPDNYVNNPLADLATEKMKEINEAYNTVVTQRGGHGGGSSHSGYSNAGYSSSTSTGYAGASSSNFAHVRSMINAGQIGQAQSVLDAVPISQRDAEWHFLMGSVMYRKGWVNEAYINFQNACRQDPNNPEYKEALNRLSGQMNGFGGFGGGYNVSNQQQGGCTSCDICTGLMCADCLCGGFGGGGC